jgi:hypothetical protein
VIKATINFLSGVPSVGVTIGVGEDIKAPRDLAALEKQGWVVDDGMTITYKAWLAGKRQGDIQSDSKFETWIDDVSEVDVKPSRKQIEQAVALGSMTAEQGEALLQIIEDEPGEADAPPAL